MESDTSSADEADKDKPPPLPAKHYNLFSMEGLSGCYPVDIFEGKMGPLPLFLAVNVGYDPEEEDPFMYPYESGEIMFAYKKGYQERVLMQDGKMQTWSLPVTSSIQFHTDKAKDITVSEVLESEDLPARVIFPQPQRLKFKTRHISTVPKPYMCGLRLTKTYYEPYYWCLSISGTGAVADKPVVLPRNLHEVCFSKIISVTLAADPEAKVAEFIEHYSRIAEVKNFQGDPFFQELALVCRGPQPVETVQPYINQDTFFTAELVPPRSEVPPVRKSTKPLPLLSPGEAQPTSPPRNRGELTSNEDDEASGGTYNALCFDENYIHIYGDGNVYQEPRDLGVASVRDRPSTQIVKPLPRVPSRERASDLLDKPHDGTPNPLSTGRSPNLSDHPLSMESGSDGTDPGGEATPAHRHDCLSMTVPPKLPPRRRGAALKSMTIDDVSAKLKELGLRKKLVKKFHDQRIDGVLLAKLEEQTLKTEFGMSHVEFLLLHTFITEGHIPLSGSRTSTMDKKAKAGFSA